MHVCIYEDRADLFAPLALTRPVFDLRCGIHTLAEKLRHYLPDSEYGALLRPMLADLYRQQHPHVAVNDADWLRADDLILVNGRWLPPDDTFALPDESCVALAGDTIAYVRLKKGQATGLTYEQLPERLEDWQHSLPLRPAGGRIVTYPWDLIERNGAEIRRDFGWLGSHRAAWEHPLREVVGPIDQLWVAASAEIEPLVVADTRRGPVVIDEEAVVTAFTRLEGPCYIGPRTHVCGAKIRAGTSIGPGCRVGGEVESSILHGYSNKYHDGFLGHSYVGEWVNLGAGTHNSDLRNDYGEITMTMHGETLHTGMNKIGCFLGDHTKTGLATLLNTGTSVGAFCNVLPGDGFAPKYVPSFTTWGKGRLREAFTLEQMLTTAEIVMKRRGITLTDAHKALYAGLLAETAEERRRVLRENEQRQLRRSA